jgi:hypothetical protein
LDRYAFYIDEILDEMEVAALSCRINWTGMHFILMKSELIINLHFIIFFVYLEYQLASIEAAAIGNIIRDGKVIEIAPNSKGGPLQDVLRSLLEK